MKKIKSSIAASIAIVAMSTLAGCGKSGPSESDIKKALAATTAEASFMQGAFDHVKLVSCQEAAEKAWRCEMSDPQMSGRFSKTDAGWAYVGN